MIKPADISGLRLAEDLEHLIEERFDSDFEKFARELSRTLNQLLGSDLRQASLLTASLKKSRRLFPTAFQAQLLAMEARYQHRVGHPKRALKSYGRAIDISRSCRDWLKVAEMRQGLMDVLMYLGEHRQAIQTGRLALRYFRSKGLLPAAARVLTNLGNIYHRLDKNRVALDYYNKAATIFAETGGLPLAIVLYNQANIYSNLGHTNRAAKLYGIATETYRQLGMELYYARARYSLGYLRFLSDKYTDALTTLEEVLDQFWRLGDTKAVAVTRLDLVEINLHLNQYGSAIALGKEVTKELRTLGMHYELGKAFFFLAQALGRCGDRGSARNYLQKAERAFEKEGNLLWRGMSRLERSLVAHRTGRWEQALKLAREARRLFGRSGDERRCIDADIAILETMAKSGRYAEVERRSRNLLRRDLLLSQQHRLYYLLGNCHRAQDRNSKAIESYKAAAVRVEQMLDGVYPDEMRFFFAVDKLSTYLGAAECLLKEGKISQSFEHYLRGLSVVNYRYSPQRVQSERIPDELLGKREQLRSSLRQLGHMPQTGYRAALGLTAARRAEQQLWQIERRIRSGVYLRHDHKQTKIPDRSLSQFLRKEETVLGFVAFDREIGAFVARQDGIHHRPLNINVAELQQLLRELHFVMERPILERSDFAKDCSVADHYLHRLYTLLIHPLEPMIKTDQLVMIADGLFSQIPWLALCDAKGTYLKNRLRIRLLTNPADLDSRRRTLRLNPGSRGSIFAVTSDHLPSVKNEGDSISALFGRAELYTGREASVGQLKSSLGRKSQFLHIATHASRSSENPLFSRLLMSDGPFFPFDLFETGVQAQLVSLSGCQTAAPGLYYGDSFSLAKAFHQAGARFVLASLWSVSDRLTMEIMTEFYRNLRTESDVVDAYYDAVDHIVTITANPAFWSAFALIGI